jgi:adhesin transport system outer membrane protein
MSGNEGRGALTGLALVLLMAGGSVGAWAATLDQAVREALARYPEVKGAMANIRATEAALDQAQSGYWPTLDLRAARGPETTASDSLRAAGINQRKLTRAEESLTLRQMLYDGDGTRSEVGRSKSQVVVAGAKLDETRDAVALQISKAWLDLLSADTQRALARENEATHEAMVEKVRVRFESGMGSLADVRQAEGRLALARSARRVREGDAEDARTRYRRLTGGLPSEPVAPLAPILPPSLDAARAEATANNPVLKSSRAEIDAALMTRDAARSGHFPRLDLEAASTRARDAGGVPGQATESSALLVLRYNLFRGGGDDARIRQAEERRTITEEAYENARRAVEENVDRSWVSLHTLESARDDLKAHAATTSEVLESYRDQFVLGRRSLLDLLSVENEYYQSRAALVDNELGVLAARFRILSAMGRLLMHFGLTSDDADAAMRISQ